MRFFAVFALASAATSFALQLNDLESPANVLDKRQNVFSPNVTTATGDTCADAFGTGYVTCREKNANQNRLCYNPSAGQSCCNAQTACPSGGYCAPDGSGRCCAAGTSVDACLGIKSSSSSSSSTTWSSYSGWASSTSSSSSSKMTSSSTIKHNSTTKYWGTATSKMLVVSTDCPENKTTSATWGYATASSTMPKSTSVMPFTGAATLPQAELAGVVAAFGLAAAFL